MVLEQNRLSTYGLFWQNRYWHANEEKVASWQLDTNLSDIVDMMT
jgi:hypothetical protein